MTTVQALEDLGEQMGLKGTDLRDFIKEQQVLEREERDRQREEQDKQRAEHENSVSMNKSSVNWNLRIEEDIVNLRQNE